MLLGQIVSNAGKCTYAGIEELNEIIFESAKKLYCDVAPEMKKCIVPINPIDKTIVILSALELLGYAAAPSTEMLETLGVLALAYTGLTTARYAEALEDEKNKSNIADKLNKEQ